MTILLYTNNMQNAGFFKRLSAFYIAFLIIAVFSAIATFGLKYLEYIKYDYFTLNFWYCFALIFLVISFTDAFFQCVFTANIAKYLVGIKILDQKEDRPIGLLRALIRAVVSYFSILFFGLGFVAIAFNKDKLSLHDYLANSRVVEIPRQNTAKFLTGVLVSLSAVIGSLLAVILIATMIFSFNTSLKVFQDSKKYLHYSYTEITPETSVVIPLNHGRLAALTEFHSFAEFIEYKLDPAQDISTIQEEKIKLMGVSNFDFYHELKVISTSPLEVKLQKAIIIPKLIFKTEDGKDFTVENHKFLVSNASVIGNDLLSAFDYKIATDLLEVDIYPEDFAILTNPAFEENSKYFVIDLQRKIRSDWEKALSYAPTEIVEEQSLADEAIPLKNPIQITLDTKTGNIHKITLLQASKNESFNKFCEKFLSDLPRVRFIPEELKQHGLLNLEITLVYKDKI